jgi:hypothetical protein
LKIPNPNQSLSLGNNHVFGDIKIRKGGKERSKVKREGGKERRKTQISSCYH